MCLSYMALYVVWKPAETKLFHAHVDVVGDDDVVAYDRSYGSVGSD